MFDPGPCVYMNKIATGPEAADVIDIDAPVAENLRRIAKAKQEDVQDLTVMVVERPRHDDIIKEVREAGARIELVSDGDVAGAIATASSDARRSNSS